MNADFPDEQRGPSADPAEQSLQAMLTALWRSNLNTIAGRLELVRLAHARAAEGTLDGRVRADGRDAAHKLSGILGTFGLPRGSVLAHQAELLLDEPAPPDALALGALVDELAALIAAKST